MTEWQTNIHEANRPLLEALGLRVPAAPRAYLRQLLKTQRITVDRCIADAERLMQVGETVSVRGSGRWQDCLDRSRIQPAMVLFEDGQCLVINKPAGLAIHHAAGHDDNLLQRVQEFSSLRGETFMLAPVHRLDIGTSGAVLFGKGRSSISLFGKMIMAGQASKSYLALVHGYIHRQGQLLTEVPAKGVYKQALTRFMPLATVNDHTLLEIELVTGRQHQIRYQLAAAGWPIVGDQRYGGKIAHGVNRPFLHCHQLAFRHPANGLSILARCPLPEDLNRTLKALGFDPGALARKDQQNPDA